MCPQLFQVLSTTGIYNLSLCHNGLIGFRVFFPQPFLRHFMFDYIPLEKDHDEVRFIVQTCRCHPIHAYLGVDDYNGSRHASTCTLHTIPATGAEPR